MKTSFEKFLKESRESDYIDKLLDKGHLSEYDKMIIKKLNSGSKLEDVLPKTNKIVVYTLPRCGACKYLKGLLQSQGIKFQEVDVERDDEAGHYIMSKSKSNSFPQTEVNGKVVVGADLQKIKSYMF